MSGQHLHSLVLVLVVLLCVVLYHLELKGFPFPGLVLKFSFQILKMTRYKNKPRFDYKALFVNVPISYSHKAFSLACHFSEKL